MCVALSVTCNSFQPLRAIRFPFAVWPPCCPLPPSLHAPLCVCSPPLPTLLFINTLPPGPYPHSRQEDHRNSEEKKTPLHLQSGHLHEKKRSKRSHDAHHTAGWAQRPHQCVQRDCERREGDCWRRGSSAKKSTAAGSGYNSNNSFFKYVKNRAKRPAKGAGQGQL